MERAAETERGLEVGTDSPTLERDDAPQVVRDTVDDACTGTGTGTATTHTDTGTDSATGPLIDPAVDASARPPANPRPALRDRLRSLRDRFPNVPSDRFPLRRTVTVAVAAALVLAALTAADAWLRDRRAADLAAVTTAHSHADCDAALAAWRQSTQDPALPGRRETPGAEVRRAVADCGALRAADDLAAAGDAERASAAYLHLRQASPDSALAKAVVGPRLLAVLRDGPVAAQPALCRDLRGAVTSGVLRRDDAVPPLLAACGRLLAATGSDEDRVAAFVLASAVRRDYPAAPAAGAAATVEAKLRLAASGSAPHTATTPFRASAAVGGNAAVRFVNHAPWPVTLTLLGPGGGRVMSLPACPSCGPYLKDISWQQCMGKGAAVSLSLPPGRFEMALQYSGDGPDPSHGYWDLRPGTYEECYFFTR